MIIPEKINIAFRAGLGDISICYSAPFSKPLSRTACNWLKYTWQNECPYVISLKEKYPFVKVRAVICTTCNHTHELFKYNPYFDEISNYSWTEYSESFLERRSLGLPYLNELPELKATLEQKRMQFFLSPEEKLVEISQPYVGLHLFAGDDERRWFDKIGYDGFYRLVDLIVDAGFNVVLLGGNSKRHEVGHYKEIQEVFSYDRLNVYNLLDKYSVRLHCDVVSHARAMIGTISCYCSLATKFNVPVFLVAPAWQRCLYEGEDGGEENIFAEMKKQGTWINYQDGDGNFAAELENLETFLKGLK